MKNSRRADYRVTSKHTLSASHSCKQTPCLYTRRMHRVPTEGAGDRQYASPFLPPLSTPSSVASLLMPSCGNSLASLPSSQTRSRETGEAAEMPQILADAAAQSSTTPPAGHLRSSVMSDTAREISDDTLSATEAADTNCSCSDSITFGKVESRVRQRIKRADYTGAYIDISASLSHFDAKSAYRAKLLAYRASCSVSLMNYSECQEDCAASLSVRWPTSAHAEDHEGAPALTPFETWTSFIVACVMRQEYAQAGALLHGLLKGEERSFAQRYVVPPLTPAQVAELQLIQGALPSVERFRECVLLECWAEALACVAGAAPLLDRTPLCTLEATALLQNRQAEAARDVLLPYVPCIPPPPALLGRAATPELAQLRQHIDPHYVLANVLLAKASVYCGRPYVNIAAALIQLCLRVQPLSTPAKKVGNYIVALEDYFAALEAASDRRDYQHVLQVANDALTLDPQNARINALFYHERAAALLWLKKPVRAAEDCARSIAADGSNAKVYATRATAYEACGRCAEAAADRAAAIQLNPAYEAVFEREAQQARRRQSQQPTPPPTEGEEGEGETVPPANFKWQRTLYDELGLPATAAKDAIKSAYYRLVLTCHPDKMAGASAEAQRNAVETFKRINHAYTVLSDPFRRSAYDQTIIF
ncbi:DnaJ like protein subfamily C member 7 [Strigomonas culicis]|uniref:DnaJ like protein subfamily C member 7 n=1 Tax=Strigomonas culicis TaxID=28005 RepID=S9V8F0_9TRYP|nr:DnaJ like protein subfamily C member 7 [Strigomonas culicis]|eukprot:EPY23251.1 DnaJ like protein subfamily C member 7 [Strigomonas culicis]